MVLVKPPNYHTPISRPTSQSNAYYRALFYLVVAAAIYIASEQYNKTNGLRGQTSSTASSVTAPAQTPVSAPEFVPAGKLCNRNIGIDLSDHSKWPTPFTPSYFDKEPDSTEAVLLINDGPFGDTLIIGLFHAIDLAYDKKCSVMITKDANWIWDKLTPWFYGAKLRDEAFYKSIGEAFNIKVVESETEASSLKSTLHKLNSQGGFYAKSTTLTGEQMRNRRDTIYRNLFSLTPQCGGIDEVKLNNPTKYTVIDVPVANPWNERFDTIYGSSHTDAYEMKPEYVKSILNSVGMGKAPIFLGKSRGDPNRIEVKRLVDDASLKTDARDVANDLYMAVLADVFIGYPAGHWSLMVARMRFALGMKNTFVLTGKVEEVERSYLELHDPVKMGLFLG